jgi:hypothetical protein
MFAGSVSPEVAHSKSELVILLLWEFGTVHGKQRLTDAVER